VRALSIGILALWSVVLILLAFWMYRSGWFTQWAMGLCGGAVIVNMIWGIVTHSANGTKPQPATEAEKSANTKANIMPSPDPNKCPCCGKDY
jgi:hypothetical protein